MDGLAYMNRVPTSLEQGEFPAVFDFERWRRDQRMVGTSIHHGRRGAASCPTDWKGKRYGVDV